MPKTGWRESSRDSESKSHPLWEGMNPNLFSLSQKPTLGPNHYDQEVWTVFQHDRWGPTTGLKGSTASTGRREMLGYHPTTPPSSEPPAVVWRQAEVSLQEITEQWRIQTKLGEAGQAASWMCKAWELQPISQCNWEGPVGTDMSP